MIRYHCSSRLLALGIPSPSRAIPAFRLIARYPLDVFVQSVPFSCFVARLSSRFPSLPYRFHVSSPAVRSIFQPHPCPFPASLRVVCPTIPFVSQFSRCVVRCSFGISSRPSRLPFCPVLRSLRSPLFLSFFCGVLLYSTNNFALWWFARKTVILGFDLTHLCCVCVCVCFCNRTKLNFWFLF